MAEAKRRFSELIDRVEKGERIIVSRRGKPVLALCLPEHPAASGREAPAGLASVAGALADWSELEEVVEEIYAARRRSKDRPVEALGE